MSRHLLLCVSFTAFFAATVFAKTINVPADEPTIQAGINAASNGDTVLVSPGTYTENINFNGKAITVKSSKGASVTTIVNSSGTGVTFDTGEGTASVLQGFTISGGAGTAGIVANSTSPTILDNKITGNHSCDGAGIGVNWGSPIIEGNTISGNSADQCSGGQGGGGIAVEGQGAAQIIGNVISDNDGGNGAAGGGISLFAAGAPVIMNNIIRNNTIQTDGGGLGIEGCCGSAIVVQNLFIGNNAPDGAALYSLPNTGASAVFVNNTFVNNKSTNGNSAVYVNTPWDSGGPGLIYNNIIVGVKGQVALFCGNFNTVTLPVVVSNDVYAPQGTNYGGLCSDQTGTNGNISAQPSFVSASNLRLKGGSPAIDAGDNEAPDLPSKDFAGNPRIINGNDLPTAIVDMGSVRIRSRQPFSEEPEFRSAASWKFHQQDGNADQRSRQSAEYFFTFGANRIFGQWVWGDCCSVYELHINGDVRSSHGGNVQRRAYCRG
jgi:hypothetical protein